MLPLKGVTVLDISRLLPGGFASLLLRKLGARVIKVEQPGVGDYYRAVFPEGQTLGGRQVEILNQGKESLGLDLQAPEGGEIFRKLVRRADVVIESFRPGVLKKWGLHFPVLRRIRRSLILCSLTGFGQRGPQRGLAGHDLNYLGLSGLLLRNRDREGLPVLPDFQVVDLAAGFEAALQIVAALAGRARSKRGVWIDCAMVAVGRSLSQLYVGEDLRRFPVSPLGGGLIRYGIYETSDGRYVTLAALEPKFWSRFCRAVGHPEWEKGAEAFEFMGQERQEGLRNIFRSKTRDEWVEFGAREDVCLFPVLGVEDLYPPPHPPPPPHLPLPKRLPAVGGQTVKILREIGYRSPEIRTLRERGVVA